MAVNGTIGIEFKRGRTTRLLGYWQSEKPGHIGTDAWIPANSTTQVNFGFTPSQVELFWLWTPNATCTVDTVPGTNEIQRVATTGGSGGDYYELTFDGQTTNNLDHGFTASQVETELEALSTIGVGNVSVTGGPIGTSDIVVEFIGTLGSANQNQMSIAIQTPGWTLVTVSTDQNGASGGGGNVQKVIQPNCPMVWWKNSNLTFPYSQDVTSFTFTNATGQPTPGIIRVIYDPTA